MIKNIQQQKYFNKYKAPKIRTNSKKKIKIIYKPMEDLVTFKDVKNIWLNFNLFRSIFIIVTKWQVFIQS